MKRKINRHGHMRIQPLPVAHGGQDPHLPPMTGPAQLSLCHSHIYSLLSFPMTLKRVSHWFREMTSQLLEGDAMSEVMDSSEMSSLFYNKHSTKKVCKQPQAVY